MRRLFVVITATAALSTAPTVLAAAPFAAPTAIATAAQAPAPNLPEGAQGGAPVIQASLTRDLAPSLIEEIAASEGAGWADALPYLGGALVLMGLARRRNF